MADHVFSGEGANPAADYKVWKKWATATLIVEKGPSNTFGPLLFTYLIGVAAQALEQVTIEVQLGDNARLLCMGHCIMLMGFANNQFAFTLDADHTCHMNAMRCGCPKHARQMP